MKVDRLAYPALALREQQRGVAAIEFALVFTILFVAVYGIATFGSVLYLQQIISRAAEDGARTVTLLGPSVEDDDPRVRAAIRDSLASSSLASLAANAVSEVNVSNPSHVTVTVFYPYRRIPLIPLIPLTESFVPGNLSGRSIVARSSL